MVKEIPHRPRKFHTHTGAVRRRWGIFLIHNELAPMGGRILPAHLNEEFCATPVTVQQSASL